MKLFELYADLELNAKGFESGVKKASKQGGNLAYTLKNTIGGAATFVGNKVSATTVMLGNLMADAVKSGANMGKQLAQTGLQYNAQMETYVTNFRTMLGGSSEAAEKLTGDLEDMAASTPFAMTDLADATQTLLAFGQESSTVLDTLQTLGDISMGDANKLQSLTLAFAQASSSGKLMGQDLMQMVNAGFNPLQTVVEKTGVSMGDLKDFMSTGKASTDLKRAMRAAKKEVKAFGDEASEGAKMLVQMQEDGVISAELLGQIFAIETSPGGKFYQAMEAASKTFNGLMSTLEDDSTALLGKVFKPLYDWMVDDLLPNGIEAIGKLSDAYDVGGWSEMVKVGTGMIETELNKIGPIAVDAGAGLLANFYTGLTGDETSAEDIKSKFSELWTDVSGTTKPLIDAGSSLFATIYTGLTGDEANPENIKNTVKDVFSDAASLVGSSLSAATEATTEFLNGANGFARQFFDAINSDPQSIDEAGDLIEGVFSAGGTAMDTVLSSSGTFLSRLYEKLSSDKEGAAKIDDFFHKIGDSAKAYFDDQGEAVDNIIDKAGFVVGSVAPSIKSAWTELSEQFENVSYEDVANAAHQAVYNKHDVIGKVEQASDVAVMLSTLPLIAPAVKEDTKEAFEDWGKENYEGGVSPEARALYEATLEYQNNIWGDVGNELLAAVEANKTNNEADISAASSAAASAAVADAPVPVLNVTIPVYVGDTEVANVIYPALLNKMTRELNNARYSK